MGRSDKALLLDRFEIGLAELDTDHAVLELVRTSLHLGDRQSVLSAAEMIDLLTGQFEAAGEFVYGHPIWSDIRAGSRSCLEAYMLETRHYLAAAAARMAPSIQPGIGLDPLTLLLSRHLLEEWDHERFFTDALRELGCAPADVRSARPMPVTLEWIHLARVLAAKGPLTAAACSGFMEYSSTEADAVRGWHRLLHEQGILPEAASHAMFAHVETDLGYGHAANWKHAIEIEGWFTPARARDLLNDVCCVAEMIDRWLSALRAGVPSDLVAAMQVLAAPEPRAEPIHDLTVRAFDGQPVFSAPFLEAVTWRGRETTPAARIVTAAAYGLPGLPAGSGQGPQPAALLDLIRDTAGACSARVPETVDSVADVVAMTRQWLCSIDGHDLWKAMMDPGQEALIIGYFLENFHYLASAARHVAPAIAASGNPAIRLSYIRHLEDELEHCDLLARELKEVAQVTDPAAQRPLPTTVAFVGYLELLARHNWRAYVLVSAFLQSSLAATRNEGVHSSFYGQLMALNPRLAPLVATMAEHDAIDASLGHDEVFLSRLEVLLADGPVTRNEIAAASLAPTLAWSFLDGILQHYRHGSAAVLQRLGWTA